MPSPPAGEDGRRALSSPHPCREANGGGARPEDDDGGGARLAMALPSDPKAWRGSPLHEALDEELDARLDPADLEPLGRRDRDEVLVGAVEVVVDDHVLVVAPALDLVPRRLEPSSRWWRPNPPPGARAWRAIPASRAVGRRSTRRRRRAARAPVARPASRCRTACPGPRPTPGRPGRAACRSRCRALPPIPGDRRLSSSARTRGGRRSGSECRPPRRSGVSWSSPTPRA